MRLDYQLSTETRVMGKVSAGRLCEPFGPATQPPGGDEHDNEYNNETSASSRRF